MLAHKLASQCGQEKLILGLSFYKTKTLTREHFVRKLNLANVNSLVYKLKTKTLALLASCITLASWTEGTCLFPKNVN